MSSEPSTAAGTGLLFIVSAPSGAGKTTLVERLVRAGARSSACRAPTRRAPRAPGETDGVDYNFVSRERVRGDGRGRRVSGVGRRLRQPLRDLRGRHRARCWQTGDDVVLVIDVQGARKVRARGIETTAIFVMPPSFEVLEQRLRGRSKDSEEAIQRRLAGGARRSRRVRRVRLRRRQRRADRAPSSGCAASSSPSGRGCSAMRREAETIVRTF